MRLFIAEDDLEVLKLMKIVLGDLHEVALVASSGEEAINMVSQAQSLGCSVAVVDGLYGRGEDVAKALRAALPSIRVVAYSNQLQVWGDINLMKGPPKELLGALQKLAG